MDDRMRFAIAFLLGITTIGGTAWVLGKLMHMPAYAGIPLSILAGGAVLTLTYRGLTK